MDARVSFDGPNDGFQVGINNGSITNQIRPLDLDEKLPVAQEAAHDSYANQHEDGCLRGTRTELLNDIRTWACSSDGKCIFWLNGMAGTGKSTISRTVAKYFSQNQATPLGASFFFKRGEADRGNALKLFPTVARQLAARIPQLRSPIQRAVIEDPYIGTKAMKEQFDQLLLGPLQELEQSGIAMPTLLVVIDALDECEGDKDIRLILQLLPRIHTTSIQLRVFLTSRPELPIRLGFSELSSNQYKDLVLHEIARKVIEHDIELFLNYRISGIRKERGLPLDWPGPARLQQLVTLSVPLFIFAATVCRIFEDPLWSPESSLVEILSHQTDASSSELDGTYLPLLNRFVHGAKTQRQKNMLIQQFQEVIGSIVMLESPLSVTSVSRLLKIPKDLIELKLNLLHSVISVPEDKKFPVRMFHLSFRDFLFDPETQEKTPLGLDKCQAHRTLTLKCLTVGKNLLHKNICNLPKEGTLHSEIDQETIAYHIPPELQYACRYWVYHLRESESFSDLEDQVMEFLRKYFLYWVEVMSILGYLSQVVNTMLSFPAHRASTRGGKSETLEFINDAKRFILSVRDIADQAPLQLYSSGLVFAPKDSIMRNVFANDIPTWISRIPCTDEKWSAELQVLESSSSIDTVAFSPDGRLIASGSTDGSVWIWDVTTGTLRHLITQDLGPIIHLTFGPNGQSLMCISRGRNIQIIDPALGVLLKTVKIDLAAVEIDLLDGRRPAAFSIATFSNDGSYFATISNQSTVLVWDAQAYTLQRIWNGNSIVVISIQFSFDSQFLVTYSLDGVARIWSISTGALHSHAIVNTEENTDVFASIALSPDNRHLISGSNSLKLWDIQKGNSVKVGTFEEFPNCRHYILAISPDNQTLATAYYYSRSVKLWDIATRNIKQIVPSRSRRTKHLMFSPDSRVLSVVGMLEDTIVLWDTSSSMMERYEHSNAFENSRYRLNHIAWSQINGLIAPILEGPHINIWDQRFDTIAHRLTTNSKIVTCVGFSPNGQLFASGFQDGVIRLWETAGFQLRHEIDSGVKSNCFLIFSPDSRSLACRHRMGLMVWDTATGSLAYTSEWKTTSTDLHAAFSPDNRILATDSDDNIIRLRNLVSGTVEKILELTPPPPIPFQIISPQKKFYVSISNDNLVHLWKTGSTQSHTVLTGREEISHIAFSHDDNMMAVSLFDQQTIEIWDTKTAVIQKVLGCHSVAILALAFSPRELKIAGGSADQTVYIWDITTGDVLQICEGHSEQVTCINFSPDGTLLASGSSDGSVLVWDVVTGSLIQSLTRHSGSVFAVEFSLCNHFLASLSKDKRAMLWNLEEPDVATQIRQGNLYRDLSSQFCVSDDDHEDDRIRAAREIQWSNTGWDLSQFAFQRQSKVYNLQNHSIIHVKFSSDNQFLASGSNDGTVRVWDLGSGTIQWELSQDSTEINCIAFSPDNRQIASSSHGHKIMLWDTKSGRILNSWNINPPLRYLEFTEDGSQVSTSQGTFQIKPRSSSRSSIEIHVTGENWVAVNGEKALWLPPPYRATVSYVKNGLLGLVLHSGQILFMEFSL